MLVPWLLLLLLLLPLLLYLLLLALRLLLVELRPHYCHLWMEAGSNLPPGMASLMFLIVVQLLPEQVWQPELVPSMVSLSFLIVVPC